MTVGELIAALQNFPQDRQVMTWDPCRDDATTRVFVSDFSDHGTDYVMITDTDF